MGEFQKKDIVILGISPDSEASHQKFIAKNDIPFTLLCDPEKKVMTKYGAFGEKMMYGKKTMDVIRSLGLRYEVVHEDIVSHLAQRFTSREDGNFGIFHTYSENTAFVDSLRLLYPEVVSAKWSLGQTHEGRDQWCFRISDNPDVDEDEPEILLLEVDGETRPPVALDNLGPAELEHPASGRAGDDRLQGLLQVAAPAAAGCRGGRDPDPVAGNSFARWPGYRATTRGFRQCAGRKRACRTRCAGDGRGAADDFRLRDDPFPVEILGWCGRSPDA